MDDKRIPLSLGDCPKDDCSGTPSPQYTDQQWRWFVDAGYAPLHCILCGVDYDLKLTDELKANILNRLEQLSTQRLMKDLDQYDLEGIERYVGTLVSQANALTPQLNVNPPDFKADPDRSEIFIRVDSAYHRLAFVSKKADPARWERTEVDGRNGDKLIELLWEVRRELLRRELHTHPETE